MSEKKLKLVRDTRISGTSGSYEQQSSVKEVTFITGSPGRTVTSKNEAHPQFGRFDNYVQGSTPRSKTTTSSNGSLQKTSTPNEHRASRESNNHSSTTSANNAHSRGSDDSTFGASRNGSCNCSKSVNSFDSKQSSSNKVSQKTKVSSETPGLDADKKPPVGARTSVRRSTSRTTNESGQSRKQRTSTRQTSAAKRDKSGSSRNQTVGRRASEGCSDISSASSTKQNLSTGQSCSREKATRREKHRQVKSKLVKSKSDMVKYVNSDGKFAADSENAFDFDSTCSSSAVGSTKPQTPEELPTFLDNYNNTTIFNEEQIVGNSSDLKYSLPPLRYYSRSKTTTGEKVRQHKQYIRRRSSSYLDGNNNGEDEQSHTHATLDDGSHGRQALKDGNLELLTKKQATDIGNEKKRSGRNRDSIKGLWRRAVRSLRSPTQDGESADAPFIQRKKSFRQSMRQRLSLKKDSRESLPIATDKQQLEEDQPIDPVYSLLKCAADLPKTGSCSPGPSGHPLMSGHSQIRPVAFDRASGQHTADTSFGVTPTTPTLHNTGSPTSEPPATAGTVRNKSDY